jgi:hypothetical protein
MAHPWPSHTKRDLKTDVLVQITQETNQQTDVVSPPSHCTASAAPVPQRAAEHSSGEELVTQ